MSVTKFGKKATVTFTIFFISDTAVFGSNIDQLKVQILAGQSRFLVDSPASRQFLKMSCFYFFKGLKEINKLQTKIRASIDNDSG